MAEWSPLRPIFPFPSRWGDPALSGYWNRQSQDAVAAQPPRGADLPPQPRSAPDPAPDEPSFDPEDSDVELELEVNPAWIAWRRQAEQRRKLCACARRWPLSRS